MLARRGCATRICLSCRFALARPEVVVRRSPRPFPRFYLRDIEQRQFSSSGLREISRNATDAPTEGQEASSTADPFALLEAGRRHESTQGKSKPKRKAKPNAKTNADDKINATKDALVNGQEGSPSEGPKTKPKRISKSKTKAGSKAEVERPDSPPVHDPFAALEAGRRLDIPDRLVKNKSNQNDATTTAKSKGRGKAKKTKKLADVPDWLLPTESAPSVAISTAPATSQNEAVNDASQDVAENKVVEEEEKETGLETMDDEAHTEQSTVPDDGRHLDEVIGGPADETITPKKQRSSSRQELQHRDIGINALGQPGGAIVLDNPDLLSRRRSTPLDLPAEDESSFDLDLGLLKPRDDLSSGQAFSDEVMANIDELNLREVGTLGEKELIRYRDTLAGSFTTKQLETYLEAHPNNDDPSPLPEPNERKYKSIVEFTAEWTANTPRILPSMTKKQQLAYRIITRAWNVEMLGFACLGYMRLKLNSDLYTVLARKLLPPAQ